MLYRKPNTHGGKRNRMSAGQYWRNAREIGGNETHVLILTPDFWLLVSIYSYGLISERKATHPTVGQHAHPHRGFVDQVRRLPPDHLEKGPRRQLEHLSEVRLSFSPRRARPASPAARRRSLHRARCRGGDHRPAPVRGLEALSGTAPQRAAGHRPERRRPDGGRQAGRPDRPG